MNTEINPFQAPQAPVLDQNENTTAPRIFTISGRLNRMRYLSYTMGLSILTMIVMGVLAAVLIPLSATLGMVVVGAGYLFLIVLQFMLTIQRCHDFNASGWLSLLIFVPLAVFVFWFVPGTAGENKYDAPNPPNSTLVLIGALLLPIVAIVGILAAIAIPQYAEYTKRAKAAQMRQAAPPITQPAPAGER